MKKRNLYSLFVLFVSFLTSPLVATGKNFKVSTFNLRMYGAQTPNINKTRDKWIDQYINENLKNDDAILFQEIVDKARLRKILKKYSFNCYSYHRKSKKHLYLLLCLKDRYNLKRAPKSTSYALEGVSEVYHGRVRPALYGIIYDRYKKKNLSYIFGVHLKAHEDYSLVRIKQIKVIARQLRELSKSTFVPTIIMGDFNTYPSPINSYIKDDLEYMHDILSELNIYRIKHSFPFTYVTKSLRLFLDHIFVSNGISYSKVDIGKHCKVKSLWQNSKYLEKYNSFISDHCPVSTQLNIQP